MEDHLFHWLEKRLAASAEATSPADETEIEAEIRRADRCAAALNKLWPSTASASPEHADEVHREWIGNRCGRFEIHELLGHGGMGNVFRAHDPFIGRDVALKIPHPGLLLDPRARERFSREAQAAGVLRHPNIVRVLESGSVGAVDYIAFEYCEGPTLAQWLSMEDRAIPPRTAVQICISLAEAVQHAHDRGVVHRDLKPGNILIESAASGSALNAFQSKSAAREGDLTFSPRITDFGLARMTMGSSELTRTGATLGTAEYLAPERATGENNVTGPQASDQFSLGVILYQMLTTLSPFRRDSVVKTLAAVQGEDPSPPSRFNPHISRDLDAVCLRALRKDPKDRYESVGDFADDLMRYLDGQMTVARPISRGERAVKCVQRNKALSASIAVCFAALLLTTVFGWISTNQVRIALKKSQDMLYASDVRIAGDSLKRFNSRHAKQLLARHIPHDVNDDRRTFAWQYLWESLHQEIAVLNVPANDRVYACAFTPDDSCIVTGHDNGTIRIWDKATGVEVTMLTGHRASVQSLVFSGETLMSFDDEGVVITWQLGESNPIQIADPIADFLSAAIAPDNLDLAIARTDGSLSVRSRSTGNESRLGQHTGVRTFAFSPDGRWLASVGQESSIKIWDRQTLQLVTGDLQHSKLSTHNGRAMRWDVARFSPDSKLLAVGSSRPEIFVWNVEQRREVANLSSHTSNIYDLAFSPDGEQLASASKDSTVRVWNTDDFQLDSVVQGHGRPVYAVNYSHRGDQLVTSGKDATVRVWNRRPKHFSTETVRYSRAGPCWQGRLDSRCQKFLGVNSAGEMIVTHLRQSSSKPLPYLMTEQPGLTVSADDKLVAFFGNRLVGYDESRLHDETVIHPCDVDGDGDEDQLSAFADFGHMVWREYDAKAAQFQKPRLLTQEDHRWIRHCTVGKWSQTTSPAILRCQPDRDFLFFKPPPEWNSDSVVIKIRFPSPTHVYLHDMDSDGDQDLLVASDQHDRLEWVEHEPAHQFQKRHLISDEISHVYGVTVIDANSDGVDDIVTASTDHGGSLAILQGRGDSRYGTPVQLANSLGPPCVLERRDIDEDGTDDLVCGSAVGFFWLRGLGDHMSTNLQTITDFDGSWARPLPSNVLIWNLEQNEIVSHFSAFAHNLWTMTIGPDGTTAATTDRETNILRFWDLYTGKQIRQVEPIRDSGSILCLEFSHDGKSLFAAAGDNIYIIDTVSAAIRHRLTGHDNTVECVAVSPNDQFIATASHDYSVRIWNVQTASPVFALIGHTQRPVRCHFSSDNKTLATAGNQGEVILWDLVTGQQLITMRDFATERMIDIRFRGEDALFAAGVDLTSEAGFFGTTIGTWTIGQRRSSTSKNDSPQTREPHSAR